MTPTDQQNETARVHVWVSGRVQGVGFRAFVHDRATLLKLTGWVRNVGEDRVETVAEGPRAVLERFAEEVRKGPPASFVSEAHVDWEPASGEFRRFDVSRSMW